MLWAPVAGRITSTSWRRSIRGGGHIPPSVDGWLIAADCARPDERAQEMSQLWRSGDELYSHKVSGTYVGLCAESYEEVV